MCKVGEFSYDPATQMVSGPAEYMEEQGNEKLDNIMSGNDAAFNTMIQANLDRGVEPVLTVLVMMQTDYAGWKGTRQLLRQLEG